jgi:high affinity Mn2+ porin
MVRTAWIRFFVVVLTSAWWAQNAVASQGGDALIDPVQDETWSLHGQTTFVEQYHPGFRSPFRGPNSLDPGSRGDETFDATLFLGVRPWEGAEVWANGEIDQGFGLSKTLGIAGFPNGEAYKLGQATPYPKLPRLFFRQTIGLGGKAEQVDPDINQLGMIRDTDRIEITVGKFAVTDVFDHNAYADDARNNLLNWALVDLATFDYAANAWGYTYGFAAEWYQDWWTFRSGVFDLSKLPNDTELEDTFGRQFQVVTEFEERHQLRDRPGSIRLLAFLSHGRMGLFSDAIALSELTDTPADISLVRHMHERAGYGLNLDQQLTDDLGLYARAGYSDPSREPFEFTDVDTAFSIGLALSGNSWMRPDDVFSGAFVLNGVSRTHVQYFNRGGLGILVGDGKLPDSGSEKIIELYYNLAWMKWVKLTADYQYVDNPAYNRDRGPVSVLGMRLHAEF